MFDDSCYMEPLHLAGRLIMENGGETCRVEETVLRMGHAFGFREVECFAVPSGLFVSYRKSDGTIETAVKRIRRKGIDLTRIDEVNAISPFGAGEDVLSGSSQPAQSCRAPTFPLVPAANGGRGSHVHRWMVTDVRRRRVGHGDSILRRAAD